MQAVDALEAFEAFLVSALDAQRGSPVYPLLRRHFGLDEPGARRGKRLRPRILIAVAQAEGALAEAAFPAAAAVEMLHNFSLIHDDIEDRDEVRHGRPTLWVENGVAAAIGAGDALCAQSYATLLDGSRGVPAERARALATCLFRAHYAMTLGQAYDIGFETATAVSFDDYLRMIEGKTAAVFGASCELGALVAGASPERAAAWGRVGRSYGIAFQIRDDVLGTWGLSAATGKPSGADIRRRKWSFPVAWAMSGPPSADRDVVAEAYGTLSPLDDAQADRVIAALERLGAPAAADAACVRAIDEAKATACTYALDGDGSLAALFDATAQRTV